MDSNPCKNYAHDSQAKIAIDALFNIKMLVSDEETKIQCQAMINWLFKRFPFAAPMPDAEVTYPRPQL